MNSERSHASDLERKLQARERRALEYYSMETISPNDREKIDHLSNQGWSSRTIDGLLDLGLLKVFGDGGWHVLSDLGREVFAISAERQARTKHAPAPEAK